MPLSRRRTTDIVKHDTSLNTYDAVCLCHENWHGGSVYVTSKIREHIDQVRSNHEYTITIRRRDV
jgi:hypothetical protein